MNETVLVTGGSGFIGSHTTVALQQAGYRVVILDNLCNSQRTAVDAIQDITGIKADFVHADIRDRAALDSLFTQYDISAVLHFAGLKAVGESTVRPLDYYDNNVHGSVTLLRAMQQARVRTLIFSSSATVYGDPQALPITEDHPRQATNPYGHTKLVVEDILQNVFDSEPGWNIGRLRYFNPVGAHPSGRIGEAPQGTPNNLMPFVAQVATGQRAKVQVYGNDYSTPDGTGVRDYIHVMDLALGHVSALQYCQSTALPELLTVNLGTGNGYSVLEMIKAFEQASGKTIAYDIVARRPGDIAACWADTRLAEQKLGWRATKTIQDMCDDAWRWQARAGTK